MGRAAPAAMHLVGVGVGVGVGVDDNGITRSTRTSCNHQNGHEGHCVQFVSYSALNGTR
jgi:hypothetical protein